uniref:peroxidase n=1 Tax=Chenopodium quinoa TaxID=63459 RepID=A0A803LB26_CHEQI
MGCDASVILASRTGDAEKDAEDDLSLAGDGFDTVIRAKEAVESVPECKNKVSCADILALATRDVILLSGGPKYGVELGRKDGRISTKASVGGHLPQAHFNYKQLRNMFASHGLSEVDLIALSGYAKQLQKACPRDVDPRVAVPLDPASPLKFDNSFYKSLQQGKGLLASDQALYSTRKSKRVVNAFASNSTLFERIFVSSMTRLGRLGVKTGNQ